MHDAVEDDLVFLEAPQRRALSHVAALARRDKNAVDPQWRVTLNFHPDRSAGSRITLEAMAEDGLYRAQFETGTSNGGLTAYPGGDRWRWESRMFGRAYDDEPPSARPKYGALNFRRRTVGGSPRFGSSYLRLRASTLVRTTFCYPDSSSDPIEFGLASAVALTELALAEARDPLDDYVEAHIHGSLRLDRDVEAVVLDPSFRYTKVDVAAGQLGIGVEWHPGFRLDAVEMLRHPDFRGPEIVEAGRHLAVDGYLDPQIIGRAARAGACPPDILKKVWHYVARFGAPADDRSVPSSSRVVR